MTDKICPFVEYLLDDAARVPTGDYYCKSPLRGKEKGEFGEDANYFKCDCNNHDECFWYSQKSRLENLTEKK